MEVIEGLECGLTKGECDNKFLVIRTKSECWEVAEASLVKWVIELRRLEDSKMVKRVLSRKKLGPIPPNTGIGGWRGCSAVKIANTYTLEEMASVINDAARFVGFDPIENGYVSAVQRTPCICDGKRFLTFTRTGNYGGRQLNMRERHKRIMPLTVDKMYLSEGFMTLMPVSCVLEALRSNGGLLYDPLARTKKDDSVYIRLRRPKHGYGSGKGTDGTAVQIYVGGTETAATAQVDEGA